MLSCTRSLPPASARPAPPQAIEAGFDPVTTPPDPAIVETLVNGNSLVLCELDEIGHDLAQAT
jgi:hypothetical protein